MQGVIRVQAVRLPSQPSNVIRQLPWVGLNVGTT